MKWRQSWHVKSATAGTSSQSPVEAHTKVSKTDIWLQNLLSTSKIISGVGKSLPFPFVQGACEAVEVLLEQISLMKTNHSDLKTVAQQAVETVKIITDAMQPFKKDDNIDERYKAMCEDFTQEIVKVSDKLKNLGRKPRGLRVARRYFEAYAIQNEISASKEQIQKLKSDLTLASVIGTRLEVASVNRGVDNVQRTTEETFTQVSDMGEVMHVGFGKTHHQLDSIHASIKDSRAALSAPQLRMDTHDNSRGHTVHNTGTFASSHGAVIITRPSRKTGASRNIRHERALEP